MPPRNYVEDDDLPLDSDYIEDGEFDEERDYFDEEEDYYGFPATDSEGPWYDPQESKY